MRYEPIRRVAVTGLGALSPNGLDRDSYREALRDGRSGVSAIEEFDASGLGSRVAGAIRGVDLGRALEPKQLRVVPRTAPLAILAGLEAMADAGLDPEGLDLETRRQVGVILGTGGGGIAFVEELYGYYYRGQLEKATALAVPAGTPGNISSELSIRLGLRGPSHVVSTGCTSSTDAIGLAFRRIQHGETPVMLTGGADAPIAPAILLGFDVMGIISRNWNDQPARACRPFSRDRDGFVLAEGSWMLLLEEREHALARGAHIYGELLGYASTCDAWHRVSMSSDLDEPVRAIRLALQDAGLTADDVEYANLHGTGTPLNDRVETAALKRALGPRAASVPMSSTKSMIGHPQGACGAAGLVATLLALEAGFLPPTINLDEPDPECDLDYVPHRSRPAGGARIALCNCMGFGSKNSALVVRLGDEP
ncbi:beta-ketoacyl-[acyl-carrier-protein] synthase family protein [Tautonia sociabilis]|uniref:Beta-ketoacyl-[acyl-carrier-protein] synthase family protein n=1 Tax=Tautonia sociabilis TaxID=2080755 RepID=A0A432MQR5_9BACT|nr:beta-ketoacyl-[acyl-carrier-protein] synthase family protein [Tautonia sociabilis]RUL89599.1 beta-ketoacyl-[acyl-carrier-protein] synthase family protein [Tautonia sociabilis]